jgi:hypothetical protein
MMPRTWPVTIGGCAAAAVLLSGCTTPYHAYEGPRRPVSELALITQAIHTNTFTVAMLGQREKRSYDYAVVLQVDGRSVRAGNVKLPARGGQLYVRPGRHELLCESRFLDDSSNSGGALPAYLNKIAYADRGSLTVATRPGRSYTLQQKRNTVRPFNTQFWITDDKTGEVLARSAPAPEAGAQANAVAGGTADAGRDLASANTPFFLNALPADRAVLCVFRNRRMVGAVVSYQVAEGDAAILALNNGSYAYARLPPGDHLFAPSFGVNRQSLGASFLPGRVYYYRAEIDGAMVPVPETEALAAIQKLKPTALTAGH